MNFFKKLRPARDAYDEVKVVADLDRMISDPVGFRFQGKVHVIKPMTQEVFLKTASAFAKMDQMRKDPVHDVDKLISVYVELFSRCCDTIGVKEVRAMTDSQKGAIVQQIVDCITGRAHVDDSKKKLQNKLA